MLLHFKCKKSSVLFQFLYQLSMNLIKWHIKWQTQKNKFVGHFAYFVDIVTQIFFIVPSARHLIPSTICVVLCEAWFYLAVLYAIPNRHIWRHISFFEGRHHIIQVLINKIHHVIGILICKVERTLARNCLAVVELQLYNRTQK